MNCINALQHLRQELVKWMLYYESQHAQGSVIGWPEAAGIFQGGG